MCDDARELNNDQNVTPEVLINNTGPLAHFAIVFGDSKTLVYHSFWMIKQM